MDITYNGAYTTYTFLWRFRDLELQIIFFLSPPHLQFSFTQTFLREVEAQKIDDMRDFFFCMDIMGYGI